METKLIKITSADDKQHLAEVSDILRSGGLVGIPTETVYGLAANALDGNAVAKIFTAKGRPQDNPLIVHISHFQELSPLVTEIPKKAVQLAKAFWPGPLTIIMKKSELIPDEVSCGLPTVAIRMPSHKIANAIIKSAAIPLAAPSANTSGKPSPTSVSHVMHDMDGKIEAIVDGGECDVGIESTVITLCTNPPTLLRPGAVTLSQLQNVIGDITVDPAILSDLDVDTRPASPGMKYKHYSPDAEVLIIKGSLNAFTDYTEKNREGTAVLCFNGEENRFHGMPVYSFGSEDDSSAQAHKLFSILRSADEIGCKKLFVRSPDPDGVGMAVYNRLLRAAAFKVIEV